MLPLKHRAVFCRTLAVQLAAGADPVSAAQTAAAIVPSGRGPAGEHLVAALSRGESFSVSLGHAALLTPAELELIAIGERSGAIDEVLRELADFAEEKIALALDLQLRAGTDGAASLDDVMRLLWQRHGLTGVGVPEDGIFAAVREVGGERLGVRLAKWLQKAVEGCEDLPLARLLRPFGVSLRAAAAGSAPVLGLKLGGGSGEAKVANVYDDGPAQAAGISAGDVLIALDGLRIASAKGLDELLARRRVGDEVELHLFRRDELMRFRAVLAAAPAERQELKLVPRADSGAVRLRRGWLGA